MDDTFPTGVSLERDQHVLERLNISTPVAEAQIYLLGAHVTHWQPRGHDPVLFMSDASWFEVGKPIRGGVPICFPWFGMRDDQSPGHGLVRQKLWNVDDVVADSDGSVTAILSTGDDDATRAVWPHRFRIVHRVTVGRTLRMELDVTNTGAEPFTFTEALHTYFAVADVREISIEGTQGATYRSKVEGGMKQQPNEPLRVTGETDRVYDHTTASCVIVDPLLKRRITNEKTNSRTTVIWNPWIAKAKAMPDFGDDEWPKMMCIETVNADANAITLEPGATHSMTALVTVEK